MPPYADIRPTKLPQHLRWVLAALACAGGVGMPWTAARAECAAATGPSGAAGTSALYGELSNAVRAEPLSVDITAKAIGGTCTWVYEVKVLTVEGNVAILDFDLAGLDLRDVQGPGDDPEVARPLQRLTEARRDAKPSAEDAGAAGEDEGGSGESGSGESGSEGGESGGGEAGGEGGGSGSGSGGSGNSGSGNSGSGSGGSGGGEGGSGGGEGGGGEGGGGEGSSGH